MGTTVEIKSVDYSCREVKKYAQTLSKKLSFQNSESLVNKFLNVPKNKINLISFPILFQIIQYGIKLVSITDGFFNPAYLSPKNSRIFKLKNTVLLKEKKTIFDPSGYAKGYVIWKIYKKFFKNRSYGYINAGGDILLWGKKEQKVGFTTITGKIASGCLRIKGFTAVMSSGTYLRKKIFNPFTNHKITTVEVSVVIGQDPVIADGLATTLIIKPDIIFKLTKIFPTWGFYIKKANEETLKSPGWYNYFLQNCH